jgi:hypothetical protein
MTLTKEEAFDLFDYATSIAEDVSLFIDGELTGADLLRTAYVPETKNWLLRSFRKRGVEGTRKYLSRTLKRFKVYRY